MISLIDHKLLLGLCSSCYKTELIEDSLVIETNFGEVFEFPREICVVTLEDNLQGAEPFKRRDWQKSKKWPSTNIIRANSSLPILMI